MSKKIKIVISVIALLIISSLVLFALGKENAVKLCILSPKYCWLWYDPSKDPDANYGTYPVTIPDPIPLEEYR